MKHKDTIKVFHMPMVFLNISPVDKRMDSASGQ